MNSDDRWELHLLDMFYMTFCPSLPIGNRLIISISYPNTFRGCHMSSSGSEVVKDLVQVLAGIGEGLAEDISAQATVTTASSSSISVSAHSSAAKPSTGKPNLFFKFGQAIADVAVSLVCCACNKGQQNISAQVESPVDATQVQAAPKPKPK